LIIVSIFVLHAKYLSPILISLGRNSELALLEQQVRKVISGTGSIVNIIGEAGIGKTRLLAELNRILYRFDVKIVMVTIFRQILDT
jgi:hypothetical protein